MLPPADPKQVGDEVGLDSILAEYDRERNRYFDFVGRLEDLFKLILTGHKVRVHSVTSRVKERDSLAAKLRRNPGKYSALADMTDIAGLRVTTYFEEDVEKVVRIIEQEFEIDVENSGDRREKYDPDRFGYLSWHQVVGLSAERKKLTEYRQFPELKAEIQTRSILQHAWAEMEHDLGYKSSQEIPKDARRRFSLLAGLLELADQEFNRLRRDLESYAWELGARLESDPAAVAIDRDSLSAFIESNRIVRALDRELGPASMGPDFPEPELGEDDVDRMLYFDIDTIAKLDATLHTNVQRVRLFYYKWRQGYPRPSWYQPGKSLFFLAYVLLGQMGSEAKALDYLRRFNIVSKYETRRQLAWRIIETYKQIEAEEVRLGT